MIREMVEDDLSTITLNEYVDSDHLAQVRKLFGMYQSWTLIRDGIVRVIMFYRNYTEDNYEGFFLCSSQMNAFDGKELRDFLHYGMKRLNMKRMETLSLDCDVINRWHEFLGFTCEGVKRKYAKNCDFKMWAIVF